MDLFQRRCQLNKNVKANTSPLTSGYKRHFTFFSKVYWIDRKIMHIFVCPDISWQFAVQILIYIRNNHVSIMKVFSWKSDSYVYTLLSLISSDSTSNFIDFMRMVPLEKAELHHSNQRKSKKIFSLNSQQRGKMKTSPVTEWIAWHYLPWVKWVLDLSILGEYYKYVLVLR